MTQVGAIVTNNCMTRQHQIVSPAAWRKLTFHIVWLHGKLEGDFQALSYVSDLSHQLVIVLILVWEVSIQRDRRCSGSSVQ